MEWSFVFNKGNLILELNSLRASLPPVLHAAVQFIVVVLKRAFFFLPFEKCAFLTTMGNEMCYSPFLSQIELKNWNRVFKLLSPTICSVQEYK